MDYDTISVNEQSYESANAYDYPDRNDYPDTTFETYQATNETDHATEAVQDQQRRDSWKLGDFGAMVDAFMNDIDEEYDYIGSDEFIITGNDSE
ncbi:unnamed protein product [Litomosoides sigmodontis]|uniref:Uncharacterized protein n=1 Tax=Litomosoides sigmodontis TaxID=42156 RepID=A0A3P6TKI1_LITSI|nr:unnamed protein product [Litomosoides sigmodontis]